VGWIFLKIFGERGFVFNGRLWKTKLRMNRPAKYVPSFVRLEAANLFGQLVWFWNFPRACSAIMHAKEAKEL
jgi:hypothetical protein